MRKKTWIQAMSQRDRARVVTRDGIGAAGANIIVHDVMLCFLITLATITLFEMVARLLAIAVMPVLLLVLVVSAVTAFVVIVVIMLVSAIALVVAMMMIVLIAMIIRMNAMAFTVTVFCWLQSL
jgi:hypothetical protein